ncbi:hypothetical protein [Leptospira kmetyi]|uniref:Uncharacterized protein n=1 Tax=Leptospira kmetyi TaxID=408139 RepID=A0ABX4NET9_9LEPT|nr:hypothetical protein [Leptospira kmetyi]EQA54053.1 hypothetical protein LEP1GSC052_2725 [Leptospira kmetyi serovar Malaysia str. Bejo-Iso9]PJZ31043.1 hypothetical protein CH378_05180 [Leptospira kmetyi]TGK16946.1 hypothetical protein EHO62_14695 [Leptospira kmetyi]TGK32963.1 hypothetical protein EHO66_04310 [Leptospira kmetyi]TGL70458.1 hypothetical protein EHQ67_06650 [Leptospira kmetyi]
MTLQENKKEKNYTYNIASEEGAGAILRLIGILSRKSIDWKDWRLWRNIENKTQDILIVIQTGEPEKILNLFRSIPEIIGVHYVESDFESETIPKFSAGKTGEQPVSVM